MKRHARRKKQRTISHLREHGMPGQHRHQRAYVKLADLGGNQYAGMKMITAAAMAASNARAAEYQNRPKVQKHGGGLWKRVKNFFTGKGRGK
jgi:hypothetical protein